MQTSEEVELLTKEYEDDDLNHHPSTVFILVFSLSRLYEDL